MATPRSTTGSGGIGRPAKIPGRNRRTTRSDEQDAGGQADGGGEHPRRQRGPGDQDEDGQAEGADQPVERDLGDAPTGGSCRCAAAGASATGRRRGAPGDAGRAARSRRRPAGASAGCGRCRTARASAGGRAGTCRRPTGSRPSSAGCQDACGTRSHAPDGHDEGDERRRRPSATGRRGTWRWRSGASRRRYGLLRSRHGLPGESTVVVGGATAGSLGLHYPRRRVFDPS